MQPSDAEDPVLASARREATGALVVWLIATVYSVGYSYLFGYNRSVESLRFVWGVPDWVFWGIVVPWLACLAVSGWFAFVFIQDVDLGKDPEEEEADRA